MTRIFFACAIVASLTAANLKADQPAQKSDQPNIVQLSATTAATEMPPIPSATVIPATSQFAATPEMWFYEQEWRHYDDPRTAIRAQAAAKTAQRNARMASMQWYGLSNSRPLSGCDPFHGIYSPKWVSNGYDPSLWVGSAGSTNVIYVPRNGQGN